MPQKYRLANEAEHQETVIQWCELNKRRYPELDLLYHVPNGGKRSKTEAAAFKRQGVKKGVPDLCLPVARSSFHGLYIEMKAEDGKLSTEQKEYIQKLKQQNYLAMTCYCWQEAIKILADYLDGKIKHQP